MKCPKCGSENVTINMQEVGSKTQKKSNSLYLKSLKEKKRQKQN